MDKPHRHDALVASQARLVAAARANDFVEFSNRLTVWLINHTTAEEVAEQAKKTSCSWNKNTDGSIDGRFHLDPLSAAAAGNALGDEMQRLFRQRNKNEGTSDTANRRRGQALVGYSAIRTRSGRRISRPDRRCLPKANSGWPGNARQNCDPDNKWKADLAA